MLFLRERTGSWELDAAIFGRRSVREFTSQPVASETIRALIDAAVHAPNAVDKLNVRPP
jgi:nitroreductase